MKVLFLAVLIGISGALPAEAGRKHLEAWYADALAEQLKAKTEVRMRNGTRCDVLAPAHAIEVEFASKWAESIGQSLNYAAQTGRGGAIALILESGSEEKYLTILRENIAWHQLPLSVIVMRPFGEKSLTLEFPEGFPKVTAQPVKAATKREADFHSPLPAMDWIPRIRGSVNFEISTAKK
jgi:hypothetical protein